MAAGKRGLRAIKIAARGQMPKRTVVRVTGQSHLFEVILALCPSSGLTNFLHGREQEANQDCNDCNDDQQFDKRKSTFPVSGIEETHGKLHRDKR
jgi:hypothetical protein